jgi:hypothetical protein
MKHYFDVEVAKEVGVNAAIIYENLSFWVKHNTKQGKNLKEGVYWMYATQKDIAAQFDYLSIKQVRTAIEKLEKHEYIKIGSFNRHGYDRTAWYSLTEKGNCESPDGEKQVPAGANGQPTRAIGFDLGGLTIPDIEKDNKNKDIKQRALELAANCGAVCNL